MGTSLPVPGRTESTETVSDGIIIAFDVERPTMEEAITDGDWSAFWSALDRLRVGERIVFDGRAVLRDAGYLIYIASDGTMGPYSIGLVRSADPYAPLLYAGTDGANYGLTTEDIIATLRGWESSGAFEVMAAGRTGLMLHFSRLPDDVESFIGAVKTLCRDVHQAVPPHYHRYQVAVTRDIMGESLESMEITDEALQRILRDTGRLYLWWD